MKLLINEPFSLEVTMQDGSEKVITGTYKEYTPALRKIIQNEFKEETDKAKLGMKKSSKLQRLVRRLERWEESETKTDEEIEKLEDEIYSMQDEIQDLQDEIENMNTEERSFIRRIELQFNTEVQQEIKELCKVAGYHKVFDTVAEDINEKKGNATKN